MIKGNEENKGALITTMNQVEIDFANAVFDVRKSIVHFAGEAQRLFTEHNKAFKSVDAAGLLVTDLPLLDKLMQNLGALVPVLPLERVGWHKHEIGIAIDFKTNEIFELIRPEVKTQEEKKCRSLKR